MAVVPEKRVVPVAAAVVAHGRGRAGVHLPDKLVDGQFGFGLVGHGLVEVVHVGFVVATVVDFHRLLVNRRLQRTGVVGQGREGELRRSGKR